MLKKFLLSIILLGAFIYGCSDHSVATVETGKIEGTVLKAGTNGNQPVANAYIFWEDSLMATTDANGYYEISDLEEGSQNVLCSALYALDMSKQINIKAHETNTLDFLLTPDSTIARVYGEFQDIPLYNEKLSEVEGLESWTDIEVFEGTTGATIQVKWLGQSVKDCIVSLGDSILAYDDGFGQYWFKLQIGTYPIIGSSEGYTSKTKIVKIEPERVYCNFFLNRE